MDDGNDDGSGPTHTLHLKMTGIMCQKSCGTFCAFETLRNNIFPLETCSCGLVFQKHLFFHFSLPARVTVENARKAIPNVIYAKASFEKSYATVTAWAVLDKEHLQVEAIDAVELGFDTQLLLEQDVTDCLLEMALGGSQDSEGQTKKTCHQKVQQGAGILSQHPFHPIKSTAHTLTIGTGLALAQWGKT